MGKGKFITFEGGEGSGKSTQSKLLFEAFGNAGIEIIHTREPGGTVGAEEIRELLVKGEVSKWDAPTEMLLHLAARRDHVVKLMKPALNDGKYVICDRFSDSTMAYQGYGHQLGSDLVEQLQQSVIGDFKPDFTIIMDVSVEMGKQRAEMRGGKENRYEEMGTEFHERVRSGFLEIAKNDSDRCVVLAGDNDVEKIHLEIVSLINARMGISLVPVCEVA